MTDAVRQLCAMTKWDDSVEATNANSSLSSSICGTSSSPPLQTQMELVTVTLSLTYDEYEER